MVESKNTKTAPRAKIAHKLARYVRANPINLQSRLSARNPAVSHLTFGGQVAKKLRNNAHTWYPADDEKTLFKRKRNHPKPTTGRKSIQPGSVVILLSGKHKGRRVVVLKSLVSGNLLVTGPYSINGVPLKRVNPAYVISTSTKVPIEGVNANIDDAFFKRETRYTASELKNASQTRLKKVEQSKQASQKWRQVAKQTQKTIDAKLLQNIKKVEQLKGYLGTKFTLYNNTKPHELTF